MIAVVALALFGRKETASASNSLGKSPDETLMVRYAAGDVAAFEELLRRHERAVFNFIARFLGDRSASTLR